MSELLKLLRGEAHNAIVLPVCKSNVMKFAMFDCEHELITKISRGFILNFSQVNILHFWYYKALVVPHSWATTHLGSKIHGEKVFGCAVHGFPPNSRIFSVPNKEEFYREGIFLSAPPCIFTQYRLSLTCKTKKETAVSQIISQLQPSDHFNVSLL